MRNIIPVLIVLLIVGLILLNRRSGMATTFNSAEMRKLPCGRILYRTVEENGDTFIKTVRVISPSGSVLITKAKEIHPDHCNKIRAGKFVPHLWDRDGSLGCLKQLDSRQ